VSTTPSPDATTLHEWRRLAERAAQRAGDFARSELNAQRRITHKGYRDLVTDADFAAQETIVQLIRERFPDHGFLAEEEQADLPATGAVRWIIDPIDGTSNYSRGIPLFCVSIGVAVADQIVVGVIYAPMQDELFSTVRGGGATCNGEPLSVSDTASINASLFGLDWSRSPQQRAATLRILHAVGTHVRTIRGIGSAALALAWVAAGRLDAYFNLNLSPWDVAAGRLLVSEAGGTVTDVQRQPLPSRAVSAGLATNGALHAPLLDLIAAQQTDAQESSS